MIPRTPAVWFPTLRAGTGTDIYTERLVQGLLKQGIRAEISWLPHYAEYAPWLAPAPKVPEWATLVHVNTCMHPRFIPHDLPVVATIHHAVHHSDTTLSKGRLRTIYQKHWIAPIERRVLQRATKTIAVSKFVANSARESLLDVPMDVIYNGVDSSIFRPGNCAHRLGTPFRLLYVGSWKPMKGVDLLAPIMRKLGSDFELLYTGGSAADKDKPGMPANMHDIGRLSGDKQVAQAMQDADALLFPTRSEGFGLVAAEAIACHLPVIATDCCSLPEIVSHGNTGILCPPENIQAFADAALTLSKEGLQSGTEEKNIITRFSIEDNLKATIDVYHQALSNNR